MTIVIIDSRPDFDKACDDAYKQAILEFGIDENGNSSKVNFDRSSSSICVKFISYKHKGTMIGHEYLYKFEAWIEPQDTNYDDDRPVFG